MSDISQKITHHWITTYGVCKVCFGEIPEGHSVGCYVFVEEQKTKRLERELAAANRKIQRLVEAGDEMAIRIGCGCDFNGCGMCQLAEKDWTAAKEEKAS